MAGYQNNQENRSGVALVIVLALLALLMIISASFLFTMRIERAGAANNRHDWVATQIAHAGFDYALASIDHFFLNTGSNGWHNGSEPFWEYIPRPDEPSSRRRKLTLNADTFVSIREDLSKNQEEVNVAHAKGFIPLGSKASGFLPPGLAFRGSASDLILDAMGRNTKRIDPPEWIPVRPFGALDKDSLNRDGDDGQKDKNPVIGRYAFMAFDTTGLIDANRVMTNGAVRAWGRYPGEIQLDHRMLAADFRDPDDERKLKEENVKEFIELRDSDDGYVSLQDMAILNRFFDPLHSRHLKTFSYEPPWPGWTNTELVVDIGRDEAALQRDFGRIVDAFYDSGLTENQSYYAAFGLLDYIDGNSIPVAFKNKGIEDWFKKNRRGRGNVQVEDLPFCRPATEAMPLMAGGAGRIKVVCWQVPRTFTNDLTGVITAGPDPKNCNYQMYIEGAVPFTWMYDAPGDMEGAYDQFDIEGRMTAWEMGDGDDDVTEFFRGLLPNQSLLEEGVTIRENAGECDNMIWKDFGKGSIQSHLNAGRDKDEPLPFTLKMKFRFAGATYLGNKLCRRYPVRKDWYEIEDGSEALDKWMAADIDTRQSGYRVDFKVVDDAEKKKELVPDSLRKVSWTVQGTGARKSKVIDCKTWVAEAVTWAEVFDPRYAYKEMARESSGPLEHFLKGVYRTSHPSFDRTEAPGGIDETSILELCDDYNDFKGLRPRVHDLATAKEPRSHGHQRRPVTLKRLLDNYFHFSPFHFGPVATWTMQHPRIPEQLLNIHMDGVRLGASEDSVDDPEALWRCYVKNKPMESAGELGYLPIGPWLTIRLYDYNEKNVADGDVLETDFPDNRIPGYDGYPSGEAGHYPGFHTVLDHFAVEPTVARPGRINIDSPDVGVIASVFYKQPIVGTDISPFEIDDVNAKALAEIVMALRKGGRIDMLRSGEKDVKLERASDFGMLFYPITDSVSAGYTGGSEIACRSESDDGCLASKVLFDLASRNSGAFLGEFEREELIGRSYNLFTNRGKSFLIVVKAQAYTPGFFKTAIKDETGAIHASRTLVAEVWRDTVDENGDGLYPWKIVSVKMLDE